MARKRKAAVSRTPVTTSSLLGRALGETEFRGGVRRPNIVTAAANPDKTRMARMAQSGGFGVGAPQTRQAAAGARTAGMLIDNVQTSRAFLSGYALEAYRTSFANGLNNRSGTYDVPGYFVQMNQLNGGILYWPVTLAEKYQWFRYWARCIYLDDKHLGNILMADGTEKDIRKIVQGDEVVTGLGTIRSVKNTFQRLCEDNAYSVEAVGCQPIKTTHHHPFYILRREAIYQNWDTKDYHRRKEIKFKPEWIHAEQLQIGDHILRPMNPQLGGTGLVLGNLAAFLGFYCAEGNLIDSCGSHKIQLTVNSSEVAYTQGLMAAAIASSGNKVRTRKADGDGWKIFGSSKEAFALCDRHVGRGSTTKKLSSEIMSLPRANALEFLGAYFNGDGSRTADRFSNRGELVASTASPYLASQIQTLCLKHGMVCRKGGPHERNNNEFGDGPFWHLTIPRKYAKALIGFSKWAATPEPQFETGGGSFVISGYLASKITAVSSELTKDTVYNLEVDAEGDEKSYVCNGMVTHNTDPYVGRALDLLTDLPMSKLTLNMPKMPGKEKLRQEIQDFYQYQVEKIGLEEVCLNILYERNVIGNCFKGDTLITTSQGMVPITEIRAGDVVLSAEGRYETVSSIMRRRVSERLVSLDIAGMRGVEFSPTSEHPVFILRDGQEKMVLAREIVSGDYVGVGGVTETEDIQAIDWFAELAGGGYIQSFYDSVEIDDRSIRAKYITPTGTQESAEVIKRSLISWMSSLTGPVDMTCIELSKKLGVCEPTKLRSVAYFLRRRGAIKTETIGNHRHQGKSIRWYPVSAAYDHNSLYGRDREVDMESSIGDIVIDNDFMYLLGYWLGDGWLWKYDHNRVKPYLAWDICIDNSAEPFKKKVSDIAAHVFGLDSVRAGVGGLCNDNMFHVIVEDPLLCMWWGNNFGSECDSKRLPEWVMKLPVEKLLWLFRGMIDSDGCVAKLPSGCEASIAVTNRSLVSQFFHVGLKCGIPLRWAVSKSHVVSLPNGSDHVSRPCFSLKVSSRGYYEKLVEGSLKYVGAEWSEQACVNNFFVEHDGKFYYRVDGVSNPHYDGFVHNFEVEGSHTYCANGIRTHNCFLFHEYNEETMMWERVVMLPPEEVYVFQLPFSDHKRVEYRPERLMALLKSDGKEMILGQSGLSEDIVKHIPEEIAEMVRKEGCIVMDSDPMTGSFVSHIARRKHPYMDLGASILERVLIPLLQNENYRYTQLSLANRNMTPKNLITAVGLLQEELDGLRVQVDLSYLDPDYSIITNYEVNWQQIGAQDRILNLDSEHERIENQIFAAMGVTRELLTGEGSYSGNKITVEILNTMFLQEREVLKNYIERQLFMPLAERHGWFEVGAFGAKKYYYPQISFNRLTIRDNQEVFESLFQLYQKGSLNVDIIYELFNLSGDDVRDKLLKDAFTVKDPTFNRLLEEVHAEVGRNFSQTTNVLEEIVKGLGRGLKITNPPNAPQGAGGAPGAAPAGFGEGFGAAPAEDTSEPLALFPDETPVPAGAQGAQGPAKKPTTDEVADAVAESLPPKADEQDIKDVVDGATKPSVGEVADAVAEAIPPHADEQDIRDVVDKLQPRRSKKPTLQDVADAVAENIPPTATDAEIFDIVDHL